MSQEPAPTLKFSISVLAIDSNHDTITELAHKYRQNHVYPYLELKGLLIERCQGKLARRSYVISTLNNLNIEYITGVGHGSKNTFTGDQLTPIFSIGQYNSKEVTDKIIHLLACQTAQELGIDFITSGCFAFFGYDDDFIIELEMADVFFECDSEIDLAIADGVISEEVFQRTKKLYETRIQEYSDKYIDALLNDEDQKIIDTLENTFSFLEKNLNHLCCPSIDKRWGDSQFHLQLSKNNNDNIN